MKSMLVAALVMAGTTSFAAEKVTLNAGGSISVRGVSGDIQVSCQSPQQLPVCTIYCEEAQTMARQCDPYHVQIGGVTAAKFTSLAGGFDAAKAELANLKKLGVCR